MKKSLHLFLAVMAILVLVVSACAPVTAAPTEPPTTEEPTEAPATEEPTEAPATEPATEAPTGEATEAPTTDIGTPEHPIKVLFVPSVEANQITTGGEVMAQALNEATGLTFEVVVPTSYAATVEEMCASPSDTMAFIPGLGYAIASQLCGVDVAFKAIRFGYPVYWTEYIVARDSEFQTLEDLEGATWGYGDQGSTSGYMVPAVELAAAGVTPGDQVQTGGHNQTVTAVYNGEVDVGTVFYSVPLNPD
ncbi:MAG TPA: phosphate/phosphite/phosphonate ABC transporter substrate-binding protein, partial [Anaerolineales bacterium]|nr:phosphate/phosphite/phosphonate ABC transporter substrate-binding protein [Anaerolineales bacterium]